MDLVQNASLWSFEFAFGCQSSETGLFRTQNIDGIMGMSASEETFPQQLYYNKVTPSKIFAMCFKVGGGILTLGGVDQSIHSSPIQYAVNIKKSGWYTVRLIDIFMTNNSNQSYPIRLNAPREKYNKGKGTIVDSGTTDTYLPSAIRNQFMKLFYTLSGTKFLNSFSQLNKIQMQKLPTIIFRMQGIKPTEGTENSLNIPDTTFIIDNNNYIDIPMTPQHYLEINRGRFASRIYLTEDEGVVLGANFMNEQNIIFDMDNQRIGFAKSACDYQKEIRNKLGISSDMNNVNNQNDNNKNNKKNLISMYSNNNNNMISGDSSTNNDNNNNKDNKNKDNQLSMDVKKMKNNKSKKKKKEPLILSKLQITTDHRNQMKSSTTITTTNNNLKKNNSNKNSHKNTVNCTIPYIVPVPISPCTAICTLNNTFPGKNNSTDSQKHSSLHQSGSYGVDPMAYTAFGHQMWSTFPFDCPINKNSNNLKNRDNRKQMNRWQKSNTISTRSCNVSCNGGMIVLGSISCVITPWSECQHDCTQRRQVGTLATGNICTYESQNRVCAIYQCPINERDRVLAIELRLRQLNISQWSYGRTEDLIKAISLLLSNYVMPVSSAETLTSINMYYNVVLVIMIEYAIYHTLFVFRYVMCDFVRTCIRYEKVLFDSLANLRAKNPG